MTIGDQSIELAAGILLFDVSSNTVLLVKDSKGSWRFPSGRREGTESCVATAVRELEEETGIQRGNYCLFLTPFTLAKRKNPESSSAQDAKLTALFPALLSGSRSNLPSGKHESKSTPEWCSIDEAMKRTRSTSRAGCLASAFHLVETFRSEKLSHTYSLPTYSAWVANLNS